MKFLRLTNITPYICGNLFARTTIKLYHRVFLIPGQNRCYSSSFPVKFIPKKSRTQENKAAYIGLPCLKTQNQKNEAAYFGDDEEHMDVSTVDTRENSQQSYLNTVTSSQFSLNGINPDIEVVDDIMGFDETSTTSGIGRLEAEKTAIRLLGLRAYTAMELKKKLQQKKFLPETVEAVVRNFQSMGLINDGLYAETLSRSRWCSSSWGPKKIKQALVKKGVSEVDVEKAIKLIFADDASGEQDPGLGMSKNSFDQLYARASKQWLQSKDAPRETRNARIVRWLQYRGFNWGVIKHILNKLESR